MQHVLENSSDICCRISMSMSTASSSFHMNRNLLYSMCVYSAASVQSVQVRSTQFSSNQSASSGQLRSIQFSSVEVSSSQFRSVQLASLVTVSLASGPLSSIKHSQTTVSAPNTSGPQRSHGRRTTQLLSSCRPVGDQHEGHALPGRIQLLHERRLGRSRRRSGVGPGEDRGEALRS